jgi:hypothetical protein
MNKLFRDMFYAAAFGALIGWAIGTLFRRHRERKQSCAARHPPCRREHAELNARWQDKRPNSIG